MEVYQEKSKDQEFIIETPLIVEEKLGDKTRKYERGKYLGKGGFAKCFELKCIDTNKIYAAKVFEKNTLSNPRSKKKLINEIKLHKKLHHNSIVNFEHFFEDNDHVYILLELCSNQTLNDLLKRRKRLTEIEVQCYLIQIIKALKYIHAHKIIHRDLKLGNCFLTNKLELKLGDFGLAAKLEYEGQRRRTICGTPNYIAPEILEKKNGHSFEVDIWSLGVLAYGLLFGRPPFETQDVKETYKRIKMNNYSFPEAIQVNSNAKKLISAILNLDPNKRPTLDQILEHDFFKMFSSIPVVMPLSSMACPPSRNYMNQFIKNESRSLSRHNSMRITKYSDNRINYIRNKEEIFQNTEMKNYSLDELKSFSQDLLVNFMKKKGKNNTNANINLTDLEYREIFEKIKLLLENKKKDSSRNIDNKKAERNLFDRESINPTRTYFNDAFSNIENDALILDDSFIKKLENHNFQFSQDNINSIYTLLNQNINFISATEINFDQRISKYFEYTNKFGIVYYVNNTYLGICFNDNSNIVTNIISSQTNNLGELSNILKYTYVEKDCKNMISFNEHNLEKFTEEKNEIKDIKKKFEIFKHIMHKNSGDFINSYSHRNKCKNEKFSHIDEKITVYVKKFLKVQHAIMFRLSNKLTQFCFFDKSELVLSTDSNELWYLSKNGEEMRGCIRDIMCSDNSELIKRIKYAKNLLIYYVKNHKTKKTYLNNKI